ncbi:oligosaccharide flippase family protein [Vibrio cholerae]|uniref:oligosaccharide flippase family protein n=1 Tax=Vibrio cholerae TaxID=666 RepID=UPI003AF61AD7
MVVWWFHVDIGENNLKQISLKKNIIASYISQAYVVLAGILVLPFYITTLGGEAYGLVGFFAMLQSMFALLDLGLTPTIGRETARYRAGAHTEVIFSQLYRTLNMIFIIIALLGGGTLFLLANRLAENWLNIDTLSLQEVIYALQVMAVSVALRWMTGLYRGVVTGSEQLVWLSGFNVFIATLRFLLVFPVMWTWGATPTIFFSYQLLVALTEFVGLWLKAKKLKPRLNTEQNAQLSWSFKPIKPYLTFALSIALTSGLWVVVTQTDKLIMSNLLSLENYGYFTLAVLVASGIMMIGGPISGAIMPRMAKLEAENKREELIKVYRSATQLVTVIAGSVSIMLVVFSEPILWVWTGDENIVKTASPILQLYAAGYALVVLGGWPFRLQYALGKLKLHIIGSLMFVSILLPSLWYATEQHGMIGAGYAWLFVNLIHFIVWTAVVHVTYVPNLHLKWLFNDIVKVLVLPLTVAFIASWLFIDSNRLVMLAELIFIGLIVIAIAAITSEPMRQKIIKMKNHYAKS